MPDIFVAQKEERKERPPGKEHSLKKPGTFQIENELKEDSHLENAEKTHVKFFSTFCIEPSDVSFADQEEDEKVLLFLRRHLVTNVDWILIAAFLALVPALFSFIGNFFNIGDVELLNIPSRFVMFFLLFYYSAVFTFILVNFISWFYNVGLITERRVVDIDLAELIFKNVSTTKFELIQDVSYLQHGVVRALFHFGDVIVQTAGKHTNFEIEAVPHPDKVVHLIEDFIGKKPDEPSDN